MASSSDSELDISINTDEEEEETEEQIIERRRQQREQLLKVTISLQLFLFCVIYYKIKKSCSK